ncbi:IS1182 family transposase [Polyangium fumosum]|uniref:IS1182 family transposase n=1 Tax=Polyangium fumosum TaxID=889272 RepID=A0A4U1I598_9BACT|nr:IS1182 family transposase [Polyangium fumosum]TKC88484.1 IS1182 family transposase [Polyangium fumosum]
MSTSVLRWNPSNIPGPREQKLLQRMDKHRRLYLFLYQHRLELFDDAFQDELATMYRDTGEGKQPVPPALLAMALLLQAYSGLSDADAVDNTVFDVRWQIVLGTVGAQEPAFGQGTLQAFRERMIRHDMDRRLLERTVELARKSKGFDWKKLPKTLRLAIDSRPLEGAGRVEDTLNLLGHATFKLLRAAATLLERRAEEIAACAGAPAFLAPSIKAGLDIDWFDPEQKAAAVGELVEQIEAIEAWIRTQVGEAANEPPLKDLFELIAELRSQDLEPDPPSGGKPRIREGVAAARRVSIEDGEMRHGRKSKSKRFNGYKQHIANDLDTELILACSVTPANRPEGEGADALKEDLARYPDRNEAAEVFIDRGYVRSEFVEDARSAGAAILCRPWNPRNGELFAKRDFNINVRLRTITCPAGETETFTLGQVVEFDPEKCGACPLRNRCTEARNDAGRTVRIAHDEPMQQRFRKLIATPKGRAALRQRVHVEHRLAHLARKQGPRARYRGVRNNVFDLRRYGILLNLEVIQRREGELAKAA